MTIAQIREMGVYMATFESLGKIIRDADVLNDEQVNWILQHFQLTPSIKSFITEIFFSLVMPKNNIGIF